MRFEFGALFPLFTRYMYHSIGILCATPELDFIALAIAPLLCLFSTSKQKIREGSN